eukprot:7377079-Prymnesium_polylepis.1
MNFGPSTVELQSRLDFLTTKTALLETRCEEQKAMLSSALAAFVKPPSSRKRENEASITTAVVKQQKQQPKHQKPLQDSTPA